MVYISDGLEEYIKEVELTIFERVKRLCAKTLKFFIKFQDEPL